MDPAMLASQFDRNLFERKATRARSSSNKPENLGSREPGFLEAQALVFLRTGVDLGAAQSELPKVKAALRQEMDGLSRCGICNACKTDLPCKRAEIRKAAKAGYQAARWADQGENLLGRYFEVGNFTTKHS